MTVLLQKDRNTFTRNVCVTSLLPGPFSLTLLYSAAPGFAIYPFRVLPFDLFMSQLVPEDSYNSTR